MFKADATVFKPVPPILPLLLGSGKFNDLSEAWHTTAWLWNKGSYSVLSVIRFAAYKLILGLESTFFSS